MANNTRSRISFMTACSFLVLISVAGNVNASIEEKDIYLLQLGSEFSDGSKVISHSQEAMMARSRQGDMSQVILDFRNSAVTIETAKGTFASVFENTTPAELVYGYDYKKNKLIGPKGFFTLFNKSIKNKLHNKIPLGENGSWKQSVTFSELGLAGKTNSPVNMEISRKYETNEGQEIAIIEFNIPAFEYTSPAGKTVIQWGKGFAITDKGFGTIHAMGAQHRATVMEGDGSVRPVSMKVTAYGKKPNGEWRFDFSGFTEAKKAIAKVSVGATGRLHPVNYSSGDIDTDQFPFKLANNLQLLAFAAGEHSANGIAADIYAYLSAKYGNNEQPSRNYAAITENMGAVSGAINNLLKKFGNNAGQIDDLLETVSKDAVSGGSKIIDQARILKLERMVESQVGSLGRLSAITSPLKESAESDIRSFTKYMAQAVEEGKNVGVIKWGYYLSEAEDRLQTLKVMELEQVTKLEYTRRKLMTLVDVENIPASSPSPSRISRMTNTMNKIAEVIPEGLKNLSSKGLKVLDTYSKISNVYMAGKAIYAINQNAKDGEDVFLARSYGYVPDGPVLDNVLNVAWDLGFDLGGLAVNAYTGNVVDSVLDATAIGTGSLVDIITTGRAVIQARSRAETSLMIVEVNRRMLERKIQYKNQAEKWDAIQKELDKEWAKLPVVGDYSNGYDTTDPRIDQSTGLPKPAYWRYLKKSDPSKLKRMGIDPDAPVGGNLKEISIKPVSNEPTEKEWNDFKRGLAEYINKDRYPKAPPRQPRPAEKPTNEKMYSELPDWLSDQWARSDELDRRKRELEYVQLLKGMEKEYEKIRREEKKIKRRKESGIDDAMAFYDNNAFKYESMVGKIATDLLPWAEWLATQDMRRLKRVALQAGYPNLASALADSANLIRNAGDSGYRKWAMAAPSCAGYTGCGPQYQERWTMKLSQLRLGDILTKSRDVFSTAGLSDIGIRGSLLNYSLRDFGIEDGDIVDININQFGTSISRSRLSLLNAGTDFRINLRPGIASVEITAVNEGAFSPNTAEINVENVTRGDSRQTYSLRTGQTAVLRVEPGQ